MTETKLLALAFGISFFAIMGFSSYYSLDIFSYFRSRINSKFYMQKNESQDNEFKTT